MYRFVINQSVRWYGVVGEILVETVECQESVTRQAP